VRYTYQVCEAGTQNCSNEVIVVLAGRRCRREAQFNRRGVRQLPEKTTDLSARAGAVLDEEAQASPRQTRPGEALKISKTIDSLTIQNRAKKKEIKKNKTRIGRKTEEK
jgi:hypothetical protein